MQNLCILYPLCPFWMTWLYFICCFLPFIFLSPFVTHFFFFSYGILHFASFHLMGFMGFPFFSIIHIVSSSLLMPNLYSAMLSFHFPPNLHPGLPVYLSAGEQQQRADPSDQQCHQEWSVQPEPHLHVSGPALYCQCGQQRDGRGVCKRDSPHPGCWVSGARGSGWMFSGERGGRDQLGLGAALKFFYEYPWALQWTGNLSRASHPPWPFRG